MSLQTVIRKAIADSFSLEELSLLCTDIGIDPDSVPGRDKGKEFYLGEIINYAQRRGLLDALVKQVKVVRPHLRLDLSALDALSISGWLYGEDHREADRKLFQKIRDLFADGAKFLKDFNFATPYEWERLDPIRLFLPFCEEPESEFLDMNLQKARVLLEEVVKKFYWLVAEETFTYKYPGNRYLQSVVHDPYTDREFMLDLASMELSSDERNERIIYQFERRERVIDQLNALASEVWEAYYAFVIEGKRQLGVV